jgi:hypothetical protein
LEERGTLRWGVMATVTVCLDGGSVSGRAGGARYGRDDGAPEMYGGSYDGEGICKGGGRVLKDRSDFRTTSDNSA